MKRRHRVYAVLLAFVLLFTSVQVYATTSAEYNAQIDDIKALQAANEEEAERLNARLEQLRSDTAKAKEYQATLVEKILNFQQKIDLAIARINELNDSITYLEGELKKADAEFASTLEQLKARIKAIYVSGGELSTLEILLESTSLHNFSMRNEAIKSISRHDAELMDCIREYMNQTKAQRDTLQAEKKELADQKKSLESAQQELQVLEEENQRVIDELNLKSEETEHLLAENEAQSAEYLAEMEELIALRNAQAAKEEEERKKAEQAANGGGNNSSAVLNTGSLSFSWPLSGWGYGSITQYYGGMYSGTPHMGLDVGVPYGTPIYAAESGQVLSAEYHWSWGNNVLLWHNGTYSTRYAHMSSIAVSPGQYVSKGQVVGYVGSTGQSSGNHLHFEVYQNGYRVDPLSFV